MPKLIALIVFAVCALHAAAQPYPTGLAEPTEADKKWAAENMRVIRSRADLPGPQRMGTLPSRVVNIQYLPTVGRQVFGSCTSWAIGYYYKTWQEAKEHGWTRPNPSTHPERVMSPSFIFNLANAGVPFSGTSVSTNYQYLLDYGICTCAQMDANADPYSWPNEEQYLAAFPYRAKSVASIVTTNDAGLAALKAHLAGGDLACFSMTIYNNFHSYPATGPGIDSEVYYGTSGGVYIAPGAGGSGHEMCIIGYDDNKTWTDDTGTHKGAILVVNSWGTTWGANLPEAGSTGFLWLGYDFFKAKAADVTTMVDRIGYKPKLTGTYHVTHGRIAELSIELLAGDRDTPAWKRSILPATGGLRPIDTTVAFDATDDATTETLSWWLEISDVYLTDSRFQPPATGVISSFKIKRPDGTIWESPDCPVQTVESNLVNAYAYANIGLMQRHKTVLDSYNPAISESVWGDVDGDGDEDTFFVSSESSGTLLIYRPRLMRNDGGWNFVEVNSGLPGQAGGMALGDYDGDGLPDLVLIGTETLPNGDYPTLTRLMRNEGQCQFRDSGITLPNAANRPEWIDYNNDGRLDLVLNKYDANWMGVGLVVLLNKGNGTFADSGLLLPNSKVFAWADYNRDGRIDCAHIGASGYATVSKKTGTGMETVALPVSITPEAFAWGDVDNDGWLDLAVCGWNEYFKRTGCVLRNNNGTFVQYATIPFTQGGGLDWADIDNDGRADLCVWGDYGSDSLVADRNIRTRIYRNNGNGTFTSLGFNLWDAGSVMGGNVDYVRFFDIDRDGDLDMSVCGPGRSASYPQPRKFSLYENSAAQKSGLNRKNTAPGLPFNLIASQSTQGGPITFTWNAPTDSQTASGGLTYDVIMGTNPGWSNILPPDTSMPIEGRHGRPAISSSQLGMRLDTPPSKAFYWTARAIDPAQGVSEWATPHLFVPKGASTPGDVNTDGKVNIADVVQTVRMSTGAIAADPSKADRNGDGGVDAVDEEILDAMLLGSTGPDQRTLAARSIDTAGGTITTTGIKVFIPKNAFASPNTITIEKVRAADAASGRISPTFRISGIPVTFTQPINIRVRATASTGGKTVYGSLSEVSLHPSLGMLSNGIRKVTTTNAGGGDYIIKINPPAVTKTAALAEMAMPKPMAGSAQGYQLTIDVDLDNHVAVWANSHFSISFDASQVDLAHVIALGTSLEDSYNMLKSAAGGSFSYAGRTSWPVSVTVCKLSNNGIFGEFTSSKLGDNYGYIEINSDNIHDHASVRTTAIHEYFHLVQALYDPRYAFTKAVMGGESLWLCEAASVWSEHLLAPSGYVSPILNNNINAPFNGMVAGAQAGGKAAQDHGYGMASMICYLVKRSTAAVVSKIFTSVKAGDTSADAVRANGPGGNFNWWPEYLVALVRGTIIPYDSSDVTNATGTSRQFKIETVNDIEKIKYFAESIPDLSGRLHMAIPLYTGFDAKHKLACRLARDEGDNLKLHVLKFKATQPTTLLGEGVLANGAWKFEVPDLQTLKSQGGWRILPLVTNKKSNDPAAGKTPYDLKIAVVGEGTRTFAPRTVKENCYGFAFPTLSFNGSLQGSGWADWTNIDIGLFMYYAIDVPALPPIDYKITASATIKEGTYTTAPDGAGDYEVYTVNAIKSYKFEYWPEDIEAPPTSTNSTAGTFNFTLTRDAKTCGGNIYAVYDVVRSRYNKENVLQSQTTDANMETAVVGFTLMP